MVKYFFLTMLALATCCPIYAKHEKGGDIQYRFLNGNGSQSTYLVTIHVYYVCNLTRMDPVDIELNVFEDGATTVSRSFTPTAISTRQIYKTSYEACLGNPPTICYYEYTYTEQITLDNNVKGYVLDAHLIRGNRITSLVNVSNSSNTSFLVTTTIPGIINGVSYRENSSPVFAFKDTAIICYNSSFRYQVYAEDNIDRDSISYAFTESRNYVAGTYPYSVMSYTNGFSYDKPLGSNVTIDPKTGVISGIAPGTVGEYTVAVVAYEWRNGVKIASLKKELQVYVNPCSPLQAELLPSYVNCNDFTFDFTNESTSSSITSYRWDFGDPNSGNNVSTDPVGHHVYSAAGDYVLTLSVSNSTGCTAKATSIVKVYPGFVPDFKVDGSCYLVPFVFTDATQVAYGSINGWSWNFGDIAGNNNISGNNPASHLYASIQKTTVKLSVSSDKGCSGSVSKTIDVTDKPYIHLPFRDTLICSIDTLPLLADIHSNIFDWQPKTNMLDPGSLHPLVHPKDTTTYILTVTENACTGKDSIKVNVLQYITVEFRPDTLHICKTDSVTLRPISYALSYRWKETNTVNTLDSYVKKYPKAAPLTDTARYIVNANLGHCQASSSIKLLGSPYPKAKIVYPNPDTTICHDGSALLIGQKTGAYFFWSPQDSTLASKDKLQTKAFPKKNTEYVLTVWDTAYCAKPVSAAVKVWVVPPINVNAGTDTVVVVNQPLQMNATISQDSFPFPLSFKWQSINSSPIAYLSNANLQSPVLRANKSEPTRLTYTVTAQTRQGCKGSDTLSVVVFNTPPDLFVPTGFTPNDDNVNDVLKAIPVGIVRFDFLKIFNRFGQEVFSTTNPKKGWDGTLSGYKQATGTYIFYAQGLDYLGTLHVKKGTVTIVR